MAQARWPTNEEADAYTALRAPAYGINPGKAVAVRRSESQVGMVGDNGKSFGPFQLYTGGGLGNVFQQQTGLDPSDPRNWQATVDFALQNASTNGWGAFKGAARAGIGLWDGIKNIGAGIGRALTYFFPIADYKGNPSQTYHTPGATDLFAPVGTAIRNIVQGRVTSIGNTGPGGNNIIIRGDDGRDYYYAHMKDEPKFDIGAYVPGGTTIGLVGKTGNAKNSDPHVHVGIGNGIQSGEGPTGGTGIGFDAQSFLSQLLQAGGSATSPAFEAPVGSPGDLTGGIKSGVVGVLDSIHTGIVSYVQDRAAAMVLLIAGIFLVLVSAWAALNRVPIVKDTIQQAQSAIGVAAVVA